MKNEKLFIILMTTLFSLNAFTSGVGNGGGAIVCANENGIISAKLLDLREAELDGLTIKRENNSLPEAQLERALKKYGALYPKYVKWMRDEIAILKSPGVIKSSEERLSPPVDTGIFQLNEKRICSLEGVARYDDEEMTLELDEVIFKAFTNTDKAALYFHEALYRVHRQKIGSVVNSKIVREITGKVFALEKLEIISPKLNLQRALSKCSSENGSQNNEFYIVPDYDKESYQIYFTQMMGSRLREELTLNLGRSYKDGDPTTNSFYQKGLRIVRQNVKANGLSYSVGNKLNRSSMKKLKNIAISGQKYILEARYIQEKAISNNGLPIVVRLNTEDTLVSDKGWRIHFNKNIEIEFYLKDDKDKKIIRDKVTCRQI